MNATTLDLRGVSDLALKSQASSLRTLIDGLLLVDKGDWDALDDAQQELRLDQAGPLAARLEAVCKELEVRESEPAHQPARGFAGRMPAAVFMAGGLAPEQQRLLVQATPPSSPVGNPTMATAAIPFHSAYVPRQAFEEPGIAAARSVKVFMAAGGNMAMLYQVSASMYPDDGRLNFKAAMHQNVSTAGWFLVSEQASADLIEYIRTITTVRQYLRVLQFKWTMTIPQLTQRSTATWLGELQDDLSQDLVLGQRRLVEHKLRALIEVSNDLIRSSSPSADEMVRNDMAQALAGAEDLAFMRGDGIGASPKGLRWWCKPSQVVTGTVVTDANIETDLVAMASRFVAAMKGRQQQPRWFLSSRSHYRLYNAKRTTTDLQIFP